MHLNQKLKVVHIEEALCTAQVQCTSPTFHTGPTVCHMIQTDEFKLP